MKTIDTIEEFIKFFADLFDDEFSSYIDDLDATYYFMNGGCLELAQVIKHYFPKSKYVVRKDLNHVAILCEGRIYDILDSIDNKNEKNLENYIIVNDKDMIRISDFYGLNIKINGLSIPKTMINEIDKIESVKIKKLV